MLLTCLWSGSSSKSELSARPFLQSSSLTIYLRYAPQLLLALGQAVVGMWAPLVVLVVILNFHLLFKSHRRASTKSDFHCVCMCVCGRDWKAMIFALKADFVSIFNTCVNIRLDYCITLYKDKTRDRIFLAKLQLCSVFSYVLDLS